MKAFALIGILLCVLAVPAVAQDARPSSGAVPVQIIVDAVPRVVDEAIVEAAHDGTPDRAEAIVVLMEAFVANFHALPPAPPGSALAAIDAEEAYGFARRVTAVTAAVPAAVAAVERGLAACNAWPGNATKDEVARWGQDVRAAAAGSLASLVALRTEAIQEQVPVEAAPLYAAIQRLESWQDEVVRGTLACVRGLEIRHGIEPPEKLHLFLIPDRTWPGSEVRVLVVTPYPATDVRVHAPGLFDSEVSPDAQGIVQLLQRLPRPADLGPYTVTATTTTPSEGLLEATAALTVVQAPSRLILHHNSPVTVGTDIVLTARVLSPLPPGPGPVSLHGDLVASLPLTAGQVTFSFPAHAPGVFAGNAAYPGLVDIAPATASYRIEVQHEAAAVALQTPEPPSPAPWWQALPGLPASDGTSGWGQWLGASWLWLFVILLVLVVAAVLIRRATRFRRRDEAAAAAVADSELDAMPWLPAGVVAAFAALHQALLRRGIIRSSHTPRETAERLERRGVRAMGAAQEFERIRYGGASEPPTVGERARSWARSVLVRLGVKP